MPGQLSSMLQAPTKPLGVTGAAAAAMLGSDAGTTPNSTPTNIAVIQRFTIPVLLVRQNRPTPGWRGRAPLSPSPASSASPECPRNEALSRPGTCPSYMTG